MKKTIAFVLTLRFSDFVTEELSSIKKVDCIIVGFGLAGATLALQLLKQKKSIAVFDSPDENRSSRIAAGLFNPITGKVMTKTWRADDLFPYLQKFYHEAEAATRKKFFHPSPLYRPFISAEEQNNWMAKSAESGMQDYIESVFTSGHFGNQVFDPFGGILLLHCGYLDTVGFLHAVKHLVSENGIVINESLKYVELETGSEIRYRHLQSKYIVFCEGVASKNNPWFEWVPVNPLKGETIEINLSEKPSCIYNRGVYIVPTNAGTFKVGSTYRHEARPGISETGRQELAEKLDELIKIPYEIVSQDWGMRPTIPDRRPVLGPHPDCSNMLIFNGLGTKGVSLSPYFSNQLVDWMEGKSEIEPEVNVSRFYHFVSGAINPNKGGRKPK